MKNRVLKLLFLLNIFAFLFVYNQCAVEKREIVGKESFSDLNEQEVEDDTPEISTENSVALQEITPAPLTYIGLKSGLELYATYRTILNLKTGVGLTRAVLDYQSFKYILPGDHHIKKLNSGYIKAIIHYASKACFVWVDTHNNHFRDTYAVDISDRLHHSSDDRSYLVNEDLQHQLVKLVVNEIYKKVYLSENEKEAVLEETLTLLRDLINSSSIDDNVTVKSTLVSLCTANIVNPRFIFKE